MNHRDNLDTFDVRFIYHKITAFDPNAGCWAQLMAWGTHAGLISRQFRLAKNTANEIIGGAWIVHRNGIPNVFKVLFRTWCNGDPTHAWQFGL